MSNDPVDGGTVRYHRAEWVAERDRWVVTFPNGRVQGFTAEQGEAMGLTPPEPAPLVVTCNGHSIELSDEEARAFVQEWDLHGDREDFFMLSNHDLACDALAGLLRDARQDPQPTADTPSDDIDFDALPIGTVLRDNWGDLMVRQEGGWFDGDNVLTLHAPDGYTVVYQPAPLSPGECLRGLLAGRDGADGLIRLCANGNMPAAVVSAVGDAAREVHG